MLSRRDETLLTFVDMLIEEILSINPSNSYFPLNKSPILSLRNDMPKKDLKRTRRDQKHHIQDETALGQQIKKHFLLAFIFFWIFDFILL